MTVTIALLSTLLLSGQIPESPTTNGSIRPAATSTQVRGQLSKERSTISSKKNNPKVTRQKSPGKKRARPKASKKRAAKVKKEAVPIFVEVPTALARPSDTVSLVSDWERIAWILCIGLIIFLVSRLFTRVLRKAATDEQRWALVSIRAWPLLQLVIWLGLALWVIVEAFGTQNNVLFYGLVGLIALVIAMQWNALKDVSAGLVFTAERPFEIGEVVRIGTAEGQLRRLRLRHLEIETNDGRVSQIPYRHAIGATDVRSGGKSVAHTVELELAIPKNVDPKIALDAAMELAASSPWAVIGVQPKVGLHASHGGESTVKVAAYAFDRELKATLHADLLSGWNDLSKSLTDKGSRKG
ncbi:MAG: mechanosensitive ion channel family protein [Myxococcota bacterium]|nr:mechanosensitive ion channel family protein [Myxococcota bacterium]